MGTLLGLLRACPACARRGPVGFVLRHPLITPSNPLISLLLLKRGDHPRRHLPPAENCPHGIVTTPTQWFDDNASAAATGGVARKLSRSVPRLLLQVFCFCVRGRSHWGCIPHFLNQARKQDLVPEFTCDHITLHPQILHKARKYGSISEITGNHNGLDPEMFRTSTKCNISTY